MQISCPSCQIAYDVPEATLRGRKLRCAGCNHSWAPLPNPPPPPPAPAVPPAPAPPPPPIALRVDVPPPVKPSRTLTRRRPNWVLLGWLITACVCGGGAWAACHQRAAIMRAWPPSIRVYQLLRMPP